SRLTKFSFQRPRNLQAFGLSSRRFATSRMDAMTDISAVLDSADKALSQSLDRLFDLVRIRSISTDPAYKLECRKAAEWLVKELTELGFTASVRDTPGHPMVVAHHAGATANAPHA